jgi:acylphosphatase
MTQELYTFRLRITGKVQGTGFRDWAVREATALGLNGWVRNRGDGSVEMLVSGPQKIVEQFMGFCTKGPDGAAVHKIDIDKDADVPPQGFTRRGTV